MDGSSIDHYEEQLYSMFKSFDVNNEEALDESAVHDLCDALQLEERGAALVDALFQERAGRVTFQRFRSGLLSVLGDDEPPAAAALPPDPPPPPDAELQPRFEFGSKRYGRRSRPALPESGEARASSASRAQPAPAAAGARARRSSSLAAEPLALEHHARIDNAAALALCRDLRMDALDTRIVERIFEDSPTRIATVGEFFERLDSTLARTVDGAVAELDEDARLPAERLLDEWERADVRRPRRLLADLGFGEAGAGAGGGVLDAAALERALDAELRLHAANTDTDADDAERVRLLTAALALGRGRARASRHRAEAAAGERDKLRADVVEANARAALLAREVDEHQARLEREASESARAASARHAEELRRVRGDAEAEAERAAGERVRLQAEVSRRGEAEVRLRAEAAAAEDRVRSLEGALAERAAALAAALAERGGLRERLRAAEERALALEVGAGREAEAREGLAEARREARRLQDRADELAAALEAAAPRPAPAASPPAADADADLSAELGALLAPNPEEGDADEISMSMEPKASMETMEATLNDAHEATKTNVVETLLKNSVHTTYNEKVETKPTNTMETIETKSPRTEAGTQTDDTLDNAEECDRLRELVKDLEGALDAMRGEYEACEEYWAGKQASERAAHDAELRAADARLAALLTRVSAFERRLAPPAPPLYAIPEAAALEAQVHAVQQEAAARARAEAALVQRLRDQLQRAHRRLHALQRRRAEPPPPAPAAAPAPAPCGRCLRAEAAGARALRAEAAARRLEARLLAADLLVKELYVENCHLARHPS